MSAAKKKEKQIIISGYSSPLVSAHQVTSNTLLCFGPLGYTITSGDMISVGDQAAKKPYLGVIITEKEVKYTACLLTFEKPLALPYMDSVVVSQGKTQIFWKLSSPVDLKNNVSEFSDLLDTLSQANLRKLLFLFTSYVTVNPVAASDMLFNSHIFRLRRQITEEVGDIGRNFWVTPQLLYVEGALGSAYGAPLSRDAQTRLIISTATGYISTSLDLISCEKRAGEKLHFSGLAYFPREVWEYVEKGSVIVQQSQSILPLSGNIVPRHVLKGDLLSLIMMLPVAERHRFRDELIRTLIGYRTRIEQQELSALIQMLQHYIVAEPTCVMDTLQPVGFSVEHAFSVGDEGVFLSGWIWDPLDMVARVVLQTDMGAEQDVTGLLERQQREYVNERYQDGPYAKPGYKAGIVAFVPWTEEAKYQFQGIARASSFRFTLTLKNHLQYEVIPPKAPIDVFALREALMGEVVAFLEGGEDNTHPVHKALQYVHSECVAQTGVQAVHRIGTSSEKPEVSIIIPLYRMMDFVRLQLVSFAQDEMAQKSEIIFVLDSPEQASAVKKLLSEQSSLHKLPLTLAIMKRNGGFSAAVNAGAELASGKLLLLLNSDVVPESSGWLEALTENYAKQKKTGALSCKLLFEDGTVQHGGMYFAKNTDGVYENMHYDKGYPKDSNLCGKSRKVPAVTAACLLVSKKLFDEVGGLTTDYILGDFEDSDFCLKLAVKGYPSYYLSEVTMLHPERQSIRLHPQHNDGITTYNARLHDARWRSVIGKIAE